MNIQPNLAMDKTAFLAWAATAEGKYELAGGHIMMMPRPSRAHGRIVTNLIVALRTRIDPAQWDVISAFGLDTGPRTLRYPDVVVDAVGAGGDYIASTPVLVAEVLSSSTAAIDLGDKPVEYLQTPSLHIYIVLSQDEPKARVWERDGAGFPAVPRVIAGAEAVIPVAKLRIELPLAEIYAGIERV
jgi:Uma2 family endonuclease